VKNGARIFHCGSRLQFARDNLIDVAPYPSLTRFNGTDQWVFRCAVVFRGVPVLGGIATSYVPARQAESQVDPLVAHCEAFLAAFFSRLPDLDLIEMFTGFWHDQLPMLRGAIRGKPFILFSLARNL
jgi:hypothetical protein